MTARTVLRTMTVREYLVWTLYYSDRADEMEDEGEPGVDPEEIGADDLTAIFTPPGRRL